MGRRLASLGDDDNGDEADLGATGASILQQVMGSMRSNRRSGGSGADLSRKLLETASGSTGADADAAATTALLPYDAAAADSGRGRALAAYDETALALHGRRLQMCTNNKDGALLL